MPRIRMATPLAIRRERGSARLMGGDAVITPIPRGSKLVRLMNADGVTFHTVFVVSPEGRGLKVTGLLTLGKPPGAYWWRDKAAEHFPQAETVTWERMEPEGLRPVTARLRLPRPSLRQRCWQAVSRELRKYYGFFNGTGARGE